MDLRDKNGLTEAEFLARYDASKFERPSVTVDIILFRGDSVLLIRRAGHPSIGKLAFPGGFVDPHETVEEAARRELWEETHVKDILCKQ
ncbi:MAG: NUDIX hydrolase, partial [Clostridia bacterium]|nr:NUDIX hydrolase [Clostridia bacterium]